MEEGGGGITEKRIRFRLLVVGSLKLCPRNDADNTSGGLRNDFRGVLRWSAGSMAVEKKDDGCSGQKRMAEIALARCGKENELSIEIA